MKRKIQRVVLVGLFAVSVGTAGAVFTALTFPQPAFAACGDTCDVSNGCPGTPCSCNHDYDGGNYCTLSLLTASGKGTH